MFILRNTTDKGVPFVACIDVPCRDIWRNKDGRELVCDRPTGHLPSQLHKDSEDRAVWFRGNVNG